MLVSSLEFDEMYVLCRVTVNVKHFISNYRIKVGLSGINRVSNLSSETSNVRGSLRGIGPWGETGFLTSTEVEDSGDVS